MSKFLHRFILALALACASIAHAVTFTYPAGTTITVTSVSSGRTMTAVDTGGLFDANGTFTLTFSANSTLGPGWYVRIRNSGTGNVTLLPNGGESIDGRFNPGYIMYPNEVRLVWSDGSTLKSLVEQPFYATFTANGTFTPPPGYSFFEGLLWGAGGSGAYDTIAGNTAGGGSGGACVPFKLPAATVGTAGVTVTLGTGGAAQSVTGSSGNDGTASTFGAFVTAPGGRGGFTGGTSAGGAGVLTAGTSLNGGGPAGGVSTSVDSSFGGGYGGNGATAPGNSWYGGGGGGGSVGNAAGSAGGKSGYGGGGGGGGGTTTLAVGGTSVFGGAGGNGNLTSGNTQAQAGTAPGGGGGGGRGSNAGGFNPASGAGARGELRIWGA